MVYRQRSATIQADALNSTFTFDYKWDELPMDSLLYFIPLANSNGECTLVINKVVGDEGSYRYEPTSMKIYKETNEGKLVKAGNRDIIANRMCVFRFSKIGTEVIAVLINSPLVNDVIISNVDAENASFKNKPTVNGVPMATAEDISELEASINKLNQRFQYGKITPDEALKDEPIGTIYLKLED